MIHTVIPTFIADVIKEGQKVSVPVPPPIAMYRLGAQVLVNITQPGSVVEKLAKEHKETQVIATNGLIDTGAATSVISPKIAEQLGLVQVGLRKITSVQDEQERPVYYCRFTFPWGSGKDIAIVSCPLRGIDCLIGRDILMHWILIYNGVNGIITICD